MSSDNVDLEIETKGAANSSYLEEVDDDVEEVDDDNGLMEDVLGDDPTDENISGKIGASDVLKVSSYATAGIISAFLIYHRLRTALF